MKKENLYPGRSESYRRLWAEIRKRTLSPLCDFTFIFYYIVAIVIFSGLAIWIEVFKLLISSSDNHNFDDIQSAAFAFYPALIGASCMLMALEATDKSEKPKTAFSIFIIVLTIILSIIIEVFNYIEKYQLESRVLIICFSVFGLLIWCYANGNNPHLQTTNSDSAVGGSTDKNLRGNTEGFEV